MKQLFNNENRIAVILKNIEMQSVCSVESLAAKLDVSQKTIRNDIKELNCLLGGYACISNNKGTCKLIVFAPKGFTEIRNKIYKQEDLFNSSHTRMAYMFWQLMHAEEPYLTDDLSEEMKVARTTTIGDLNRLRKAIEKYDLKIKGKANTGLALCGDEFNIRLFILENIYEQLYLNFPLGQTIREKLYDFQERLSMDALGFGFFYRFFVVMIQRMESGHTIKKLKPKYEELYESSAYMIVDEFLNEIEQVKGYKISKEERLFLSISVAGMRTPANTAEIEQKISISEGVADLIIEILDRIKAELNVTVVANELFDDFVYHVFFMINRLKYGFHIYNPMVDDFKNKYSVAYKMAEIAKGVLDNIIENFEIADNECVPICQDTGMACVFLEIGQDVHIVGGDLSDAVNEGVRRGYDKGYLRKSVVKDPVRRGNTGDNTPAMIYTEIVPGEQIKITVGPKGFGSENMSRIFMLKPADGEEGIKKSVIQAVKDAGPNACPPMVVGVGLGGSFEKAAFLAKKALTRNLDTPSEKPHIAKLEKELLEEINQLGIGPGGLGGSTTALGLNIETYPTHIAGMPLAVNICCHVNRHAHRVL